MKVKSLLVFASAAAMPFAAAFAQNNSTPSGPQGTGWYGNMSPGIAVLDRNGDGVISADEYAARDLRADPRAPAYVPPSAGATVAPQYDRSTDRRVIAREERLARYPYPYNGFSADTNPPVPPQ